MRDGERFAVVDYKTNLLAAPGEALTALHHRPAALAAEMERYHYGLQALLYTVALHRYLRWRLRDYDPERNLAGVLYLFLRGMIGPDTPMVGDEPVRRVRLAAAGGPRGRAQRRARPGRGAVIEPADLHDARRAHAAPEPLRAFNDAGVLAAADVHVALRLLALAGEDDAAVALAIALAVRGPRLGHVYVDLATIAEQATVDLDEPVDLSALPWPEPAAWTSALERSALVACGEDDDAPGRPLRLIGSRLYLDRYWREERQVAADLLALASDAAPAPRLATGLGGTDDSVPRVWRRSRWDRRVAGPASGAGARWDRRAAGRPSGPGARGVGDASQVAADGALADGLRRLFGGDAAAATASASPPRPPRPPPHRRRRRSGHRQDDDRRADPCAARRAGGARGPAGRARRARRARPARRRPGSRRPSTPRRACSTSTTASASSSSASRA